MDTIVDYIDWRGDLTFEQSKFNEVDNLIFSQIAYLNLGVIKGKISLKKIGERYKKMMEVRDKNHNVYVSPLTTKVESMFLKASISRRFKDVMVTDFINKFDEINESQFSAMTFIIDENTIYVSYRGTDDTIVGFKENLNMAFQAPVPGQLDAVRYLEKILSKFDNYTVFVGGHSKGGNFAVYAVSGLDDEKRDRIKTVYNNDGPGFTENILSSDGYKKTVSKVKKYIPKDSFVGILMDDEEEYIVINASGSSGILQHDGMNWYVRGCEFVKVDNVTPQSVFVDKTIKHWLSGLDRGEREEFVEELYDIVKRAMNANKLNDISENRLKMTYRFFKKVGTMEDNKKEMMQNTVLKLIQSWSEIKKAEKESRQSKKQKKNISEKRKKVFKKVRKGINNKKKLILKK